MCRPCCAACPCAAIAVLLMSLRQPGHCMTPMHMIARCWCGLRQPVWQSSAASCTQHGTRLLTSWCKPWLLGALSSRALQLHLCTVARSLIARLRRAVRVLCATDGAAFSNSCRSQHPRAILTVEIWFVVHLELLHPLRGVMLAWHASAARGLQPVHSETCAYMLCIAPTEHQAAVVLRSESTAGRLTAHPCSVQPIPLLSRQRSPLGSN